MRKTLISIAALTLSLLLLLCGCANVQVNSRTPSESAYQFDHLFIELPEGFTVKEESDIWIATPAEYPLVADNIVFTSTGGDRIDSYNEENLTEAYRDKFTGFGNALSFEKTQIDKHDVIRFVYSLTMSGIEMTQTQIMIFGKTYTDIVTFTNVSGDFENAFSQAEASIIVKD